MTSIAIYERYGPLPDHLDVPETYKRYYDKYLASALKIESSSLWSVGRPFSLEAWEILNKELKASGDVPTGPSFTAASMPDVRWGDMELPLSDVSLRIYHPPITPTTVTPFVLYYHGGGLVMGTRTNGENWLTRIASALDIPVVSVEYRLAPSHKLPSAHEDAWTAYAWALSSLESKLTYPVKGVILAGLSSGGNLALSTAYRAVLESQAEVLRGIMAIVPVCDVRPGREERYNEWDTIQNSVMNLDKMTFFDDQYVDNESDKDDEKWSIVSGKPEIFSGFPQTAIFTAEYDCLKGEAEVLAQLLRDAKVSVIRGEYSKLVHSSLTLDGLCEEARTANTESIRCIGRMAGLSEEAISQVTVDRLYPQPIIDF